MATKITQQRWDGLLARYRKEYPDFFRAALVAKACDCGDRFFGNRGGVTPEALRAAFKAVLLDKELQRHRAKSLFQSILGQIEAMERAGKTRWAVGNTVVLVPFTRANAVSLIDSKRGREFETPGGPVAPGQSGYVRWNVADNDVVCTGEKSLFVALSKLQTPNDVLYIVGHCGKGSDILEADNPNETIDIPSLVKKLTKNLSPRFAGQIKVYGCESAAAAEATLSFVQKFADAMYKAKFHYCSFYGYTEEVTAARFAQNEDGTGAVHKWALGALDGERASKARLRVYPNKA